MDAGNHNPDARVDWAYDPGRFGLSVSDRVESGEQIFNNYGPKGNDELLMGYGFCSPDNPHDGILLSMRPPPPPLQQMLRVLHPGYFRTSGEWNSEAATFRLLRWQLHDTSDLGAFSRAWAPIPAALTELFCYIVQFERGLDVCPMEEPEDYLFHGPGQRYLPRIALYIMMSLHPKTHKLEQADSALPAQPQTSRQAMAKIYRDGQTEVLNAVEERMAAYLKSLLADVAPQTHTHTHTHTQAPQQQHVSAIWTIESAVEILQRDAPAIHKSFMSGVKYCTGTTKLRKLRGTEQEEHLWTIWLCFAYLHYRDGDGGVNGLLGRWMRSLEAEYGDPLASSAGAADQGEGKEGEVTEEEEDEEEGEEEEEEVDEDAAVYLEQVKKAAMFLPGSVWTSRAWTSDFVLDWGMRIAKSQGTYMDVGDDDLRYVVYLHLD